MGICSDADGRHSSPALCPLCLGTGFTHPLMQSGEPDFSEVYPCRCNQRYQPAGTDDRGDILNIYWRPEEKG